MKKLKSIFKVLLLILSLSIFLNLQSSETNALSGMDFKAGNIIDDTVFFNKKSMTVQQIQDFLNSKVSECNINNPGYTGGSGTTYNPPWVCLKDYYENTEETYSVVFNYLDVNGISQVDSRIYYKNNAYLYTSLTPVYVNGDYSQGLDHLTATISSVAGINPAGSISAAQIIYDASQLYDINPQVILVMLQKEQGLITDTSPQSWQYQSALGYGCPDYKPCSGLYAGFSKQVYSAAWQLRQYGINPDNFNFKAGVNRYIQYSPEGSCGGSIVSLQNQATANLYNYTPYQPNDSVLATLSDSSPSNTVNCGAYGNQNFFWYFTKWFGSTYSTVYDGINYSAVFDASFYLTNNTDLKNTFGDNYYLALQHFVNYGMAEGRQGNADFNINSYKNYYPDLRTKFENNIKAYYIHYVRYGKNEGRISTGNTFNGTSVYNGVNYSDVYNFEYYENNNADIKAIFDLDDNRVLSHFINYGIAEGRQALDNFNLNSYKNRYFDLRRAYGDNTRDYAMHYILYGKKEGRIAIGDYLGGTSKYSGVDYSSVYNFDYYIKNNPDIKAAFGLDDNRVLSHFINFGISEGRQGNADFNVNTYRSNYIDLQTAFGNNLRLYYLHYLYHGKLENRIAA